MAGDPIGEAYVRLRAAIDGNFEKEAHDSIVPAVGRIAGDAALAFAAKKIFDFGKGGIDELKDQQAAQAQLTAVIQSTGGAAGVTADHVEQLSQAGLKLSGTDDELIKKADTLLLGFTNIRNTDTDKTFDRASEAALNLSTRMGGDVTGAAQLLGRALQDPEAGMGRLQRVIGPLSDAQKESIKTFQAHGDIVSAQGVLLDALDAKVGGAAAAFGNTLPGKVAIAQESLKNAKAELVGGMAPALELGATATAKFADVMQGLPGPVQEVGGAVVLLGGGFLALARPVNDALNLLSRFRTTTEEGTVATEASTVAKDASLASSEELTAVDAQRLVSNESLAFSDAEVASALEARQVAEAQALISNDALIASEEELTAATEAEQTANEGLLASLGPLGIAMAVAGAAFVAFGGASEGAGGTAANIDGELKQLDDTINKLGHDTSTVTTDFTAFLDNLVKSKDVGPGLTKTLNDTGVSTAQLADKIALGNQGFKTWVDTQIAAGHISVVTGAELLDLGNKMQGQAQIALDSAVAQGRLSAAQRDGAEAANHNADGSVNFAGALQSLAPILGQTTSDIGGIDNANLDNAAQQAKDLADKYTRVAQEADAAFAAQLRLAPADIRVQQGGLTIADDQSRLADAQQKLNDAQKGGYGPAIIQAQRDLQSAQLSLTQAVNDQATALADQKKAQDDANGVTETAKQQTDNYLTALETLNAGITGPTHDAIGVYIYDIAVAKNKTDELRTSQLGLFSVQQLIDPNYYGGANDSPTQTGGRIVARAGGGRVGAGQVIHGAELGRELLMLDHPGTYQMPGSGTVLPHDLTEQLMGGGGGMTIGQVNVVAMPGEPAASSVPRALAALAFENGYG